MKLREFPNTAETIRVLLKHCRDHDIVSSLAPVDDFDEFSELILSADFFSVDYNTHINSWSIEFTGLSMDDESCPVYLLFSHDKNVMGNSILVEMPTQTLPGFILIELNDPRHPPLVSDFMQNGRIAVQGYPDEWDDSHDIIMSIEELTEFLSGQTVQRGITWITVD